MDEVYTVSSGRQDGRATTLAVAGRGRKLRTGIAVPRPTMEQELSTMKEVMAIIRMNKMNQTKQALADAGVASFTARKVVGPRQGKGRLPAPERRRGGPRRSDRPARARARS